MDMMELRRRLLMAGKKAIANINIWDEQWEYGNYSTTTGQPASNDTNQIRSLSTSPIPVQPNTTYYVYVGRNINIRCLFYTENDTFISAPASINNTTITSPSNAYYMRFYTGTGYKSAYQNNISVNYPSTDHEYHPHV